MKERIAIKPSEPTLICAETLAETLAAHRTITQAEIEQYTTFAFDPGGAARNVILPAEAACAGYMVFIVNTADAAEVITVQDDTPATVGTPTQAEGIICWCDGTTWRGLVGAMS